MAVKRCLDFGGCMGKKRSKTESIMKQNEIQLELIQVISLYK